ELCLAINENKFAASGLRGDRSQLDRPALAGLSRNPAFHFCEHCIIDSKVNRKGEQTRSQNLVQIRIQPILQQRQIRCAVRQRAKPGPVGQVVEPAWVSMIEKYS